MASGDKRTPPGAFPPGTNARRRRGPVYGRPMGRQMEQLCSSSDQVSSNKSAPQMAAPVQPPKSLDSPPQMVPPVQPLNSLDSRSSPCSSGSVGSDSGSRATPFDICLRENKCSVKLNRSLLEINREKRREKELAAKGAAKLHLRPGMVLLKKYLEPSVQVKIIKLCQDLGVGAGGFYTPGYRDGAKLNLWMMCLGKIWEPDSCSYGDVRSYDGAQPPYIPEEFRKFVEEAIQESHKFLKQNNGVANPMEEIPAMSPDICIVNFYTSSGRLGLHKDKDESETSLKKGLPVVSFSVGDTAEFLYGDTRDPDKASKVDLESGDVLLFGGKSRHIFHGVSCIKPRTAPMFLTDETNLRPGRLNLTFRQY